MQSFEQLSLGKIAAALIGWHLGKARDSRTVEHLLQEDFHKPAMAHRSPFVLPPEFRGQRANILDFGENALGGRCSVDLCVESFRE